MPAPEHDSGRSPSPASLVATGAAAATPVLAWGLAAGLGAPVWAQLAVLLVGVTGLGAMLLRERWSGARRRVQAVEAERQLAADRATIVQLVSHEFRTPLTMIRGGVETLFARSDVDPALAPVADAVQRATVRLDGMVTMLLAAADRFEVEEHERVPTPLEDVVDSVLRELSARAVGRVEVHVTAVSGVETHVARGGIVALLLLTVLDNALKFSPPDTTVVVRGHVTPVEVVLQVIDRGPGLSPDFATRAFEMFTQQDASTSRPQSGLGMGLFTARRLCARLGGRIDLRDGPGGVGCVAELRLPRGVQAVDQPDLAPAPTDRRDLVQR
jgi:signal transduction histidine kinase